MFIISALLLPSFLPGSRVPVLHCGPGRNGQYAVVKLVDGGSDNESSQLDLQAAELLSATAASVPPQPWSEVGGTPWSWTDTAVNAALFLLLHTTVWSSTQLLGFDPTDVQDRWAFAISRLVSIGAFAGLQQAAPGGLPLKEWPLLPPPGTERTDSTPRGILLSNPVIAGLGFGAASVISSGLFAAFAAGDLNAAVAAQLAWLPSPRPLEPGRVVDLLVGAPIQEELIFRGWLLAALKRNGVADAIALVLSALLFTVWHIDAVNGNAFLRGGDGGGLLQLFVLGTWLGFLYTQAGRRSLLMPIGTHAAYNGLILLLEAVRV